MILMVFKADFIFGLLNSNNLTSYQTKSTNHNLQNQICKIKSTKQNIQNVQNQIYQTISIKSKK